MHCKWAHTKIFQNFWLTLVSAIILHKPSIYYTSTNVNLKKVTQLAGAIESPLSSYALSEAYTTGSPCRFVDWSSGPVARTCCGHCPHIEEYDQHDWLLTLTVLLSSVLTTSETSTDYSGTWFPGSTQKSMSHHQRWLYKASLVQFEDTWWCSDTPTCDTPSDYHLAVLCRLSACTNLWW